MLARVSVISLLPFTLIAPLGAADLAARRPILDVNAADFPASSLADFSSLLDPPAGRHGFLQVGPDGRFRFEDGTEARFWGINVAKDSVFQPTEAIDAAIQAIAEAGFNLVRLHHLDDVTGLLPTRPRPDGQRIAPDALAKVDYWIARLKERGISVYLDLLDYRTFHAWEGVPNGPQLGRAAKPYALFDEKLIALQQEYAKAFLLDHVNPLTGLSYARDPAVCMVELCDENGLFKCRRDLPRLREPYRSALRRRWNAWLAERYPTRPKLAAAWTDARGQTALQPFERLEDGTVRLPRFDVTPEQAGSLAAPARQSDFYRFAYEVHCRAFRQMATFLREHGLRVPITAVTDTTQPADLKAVADSLDLVGANFYWDHPYFGPRNNWSPPAYYLNANPIRAGPGEGLMPDVMAQKLLGKPLVLREWGYCWPNKYRSAGMIEAAAYGRLQAIDALILFTYDTRVGRRKLDYFDVRSDPTRWGLAGLAGRLFLSEELPPAGPPVCVGYSGAETFAAPRNASAAAEAPMRARYDVAWTTGVANAFADGSQAVAPGASAVPGAVNADARGVLSAAGGAIGRNRRSGVLVVVTPGFRAICGRLDDPALTSAASLKLATPTPIGSLVAASLDGLPLEQSQRYVLKMVSIAVNTAERKREHGRDRGQTLYALDDAGGPPISTAASPCDLPTIVALDGRTLIEVWMSNGTWELLREGDVFLFWCDLPGARVRIGDLPETVLSETYPPSGPSSEQTTTNPLPYPPNAAFVRLRPA